MAIKQYWNVQHIRDGKVIWEQKNVKNAIANQGAESVLEYVYRSNISYKPNAFYMGLCNYSPVVTDTLLTIQNEPQIGVNGYTRQLVELSAVGFPTKDIAPDGNVRLTSKTVVFTNTHLTNSIGPLTNAFIATTADNTGVLWAYLPLAMTRTIRAGDSMTYQFYAEEGNN